ncbi:hypothetical protein QZH41_012475 [Actinostola sp. cb2023]|nr:hypothetical protein QZH41_012475 [Actinostola sp. cb2023]
MKLTLFLVLVFASVALLRAEEEVEEQDEPSITSVYDGSLDDEVLGNEEDPAHHHKRRRMLSRMGARRVCGRVFIGCIKKTRARCKLVPVCKVHYFACRCIIKVAKKCIGFLRWLKKRVQRHHRRHGRKHDESEEDARKKRRKMPGFVRKCKRGYRRCSKGKKFCGGCLRGFGGCLKRHAIKHFCKKHGHSKKHGDEPEDEETAMANAVENDEFEDADMPAEEEDESDARRHKRRRRRPNKRVCGRVFIGCIKKTRARCKLVPVCKVHYFACRCIIKVARKCIGFLRWLKKRVQHHRRRHGRKHDESEEDARKKRRKMPGFVRKCKRGYRRCSKGKKFCGGCLRGFGGCLKRHAIKHFCKKHGHSKKHGDEPEDEETAMANAVENDEFEDADMPAEEEDEADARRHKRRRRRPNKAQRRCIKGALKCMLRAKLNCPRQGRCVRRVMRCMRRVRRRRRHRKHDE